MLKENGLDPMILALLQRSSLDANREYRDSNPSVTDSNDVEVVLPNHISFLEELILQGLGKWLQRCRVMLHHVAGTPERAWLLFSLIFILETVVVAIFQPKTIKLLNATHQQVWRHSLGVQITSKSLPTDLQIQEFQPMLLAQQAQPYSFGLSQQFLPLGHANVVMTQPSQIQFPQLMQQVTGRPVVGKHSMPQGLSIPHDFQRNLPKSNNHMPGSGGPNLPLSSSYNVRPWEDLLWLLSISFPCSIHILMKYILLSSLTAEGQESLPGETSRADDRNGGEVSCHRDFYGSADCCVSFDSPIYFNLIDLILNDDDILDASIVSYASTDILNVDDILDASIVSSASIDIE
ncbi:hypothetical protein FXO37_21160 [Capsicum annuum]|nr:hypothetical protein FXO37_21160 [Capsicum annuum]